MTFPDVVGSRVLLNRKRENHEKNKLDLNAFISSRRTHPRGIT
jgi:hypothetical protein